MNLYQKICEVNDFLNPGKGELLVYIGSLYFSFLCGSCGAIITKKVSYTMLSTLTPQILEYLFFRSSELGLFGENLKHTIKKFKKYIK